VPRPPLRGAEARPARALFLMEFAFGSSNRTGQDGFIGIIQTECQPAFVCGHAIEDAQHICKLSYGVAPHVRLEGARDMKLPYIPEHLHYIFFELLKNSMRAVVERAREARPRPAARRRARPPPGARPGRLPTRGARKTCLWRRAALEHPTPLPPAYWRSFFGRRPTPRGSSRRAISRRSWCAAPPPRPSSVCARARPPGEAAVLAAAGA